MPGRPHNTTTGFFDLPSNARKKIYEGVLKLSHPVFLFQDGDARVETFAPDRPSNWLALLHTSRQMHQEAAAVLYSANVYTLLDADGQGSELIRGFLKCIGSRHAKTLSHLCITFPTMQRNPGGFQLGPDGAKMFELIRAECSKLAILEAHLAGKSAIHLTETDRSMPDFTLEALTDLDRHVKSISSIQRFIVRVYSGRPAAHRIEVMRGLGWEVLPANKNDCTAARDLDSSSRGHVRDMFELDAEPGAAAREGESESLVFHLNGFPSDVQEPPRHSFDVRSTARSTDIWTAAFHEAVEQVDEDINQAIIKGKDAEQLLKELERLDMDSSQHSAFSRGHEFLKTLQVPLQTFKMALDLASPFTVVESTTSVVVGVLRAVTAMAITLAGTKPDLTESVAAMLEQMSYIDDCDTLGQKANRLDIHQALVAVYKSLLEFYKVAHEMLTRKGMALALAVLSNSGPLPDAIQTFLRHATTLHKIVSKATLEIVQDIQRLLCDQESGSQVNNCAIRLDITPNWEHIGPMKLAWTFLQMKDSPAGTKTPSPPNWQSLEKWDPARR
ncbi:hypothetical protein KC361_g1467 [Hortaea werneckii]|nr:hypothetical protein KC361_g1467 [Hortaea werneckii]KAI7506533.1 hypothetical protein KC347_g7556 [Hortaea werneckii]